MTFHRACLLAFATTLGLATGCDAKPSEEDCEAAAEKFFDLLAENQGVNPDTEMNDKMRDKFKHGCISSGTKKELACIDAAKSFEDIQQCQR